MNNMIKFLGTAGARFAVTRQIRKSGGIWLSLDNTNLLLDPGPGSLILTTKGAVGCARCEWMRDGLSVRGNRVNGWGRSCRRFAPRDDSWSVGESISFADGQERSSWTPTLWVKGCLLPEIQDVNGFSHHPA